MNRTPSQDSKRQALHGVNQTIANGLSLVLARPLLMVVPLGLDLLLWLAWQVSPKPLTNWLGQLMLDNGGQEGPEAAKEIMKLGETARVNDLLAMLTPSIFGGIPKDTLLTVILTLFAPGLTGGVDRSHMYRNWEQGLLSTLTPQNGFSVFTLALVLIACSTILAVLFRVPQARAIREEAMTFHGLARDMIECWWKLTILFTVSAVVAGMVLLPIVLVIGALYLIGINMAALLVLGLFVIGGMIAMYTFFTIDAIVLNRAGPLQAVSLSFAVVRENFGATCRFALVSLLIGTGILHVWDVLIENPPGIAIALLANAFLGTGLSLASMLFYRDRVRALDPNTVHRARTIGRRWFR